MRNDLARIKAEFAVFIVDNDVENLRSLGELVRSSGFTQVALFPTIESAIASARQAPPHLVLFAADRFEESGETFLSGLRSISPEIRTVLMVAPEQSMQALLYVGRELAFDFCVRPFVSTLEVAQKLDRAAQTLYYQYENEQLRARIGQPKMGATLSELDFTHGSWAGEASQLDEFDQFISRLGTLKDLEESVQYFVDTVTFANQTSPVLYFKYLPNHASLLLSHASLLPIEKFRGVGLDLRSEEPSALEDMLANPDRMPALRRLVREIFRRDTFAAFPHMNDGETVGTVVILADVETNTPKMRAIRGAFELAWKRNVALKEKHAIDHFDGVTGLVHRSHFETRLEEEMSRSRRLLLPLSLVVVQIDGFDRIEYLRGKRQADAILRAFGAILKKTMRVTDIAARVGPDEFALLMPHTPHMGGAVKAERIRRAIQSTKFPLLEAGPSLTISAGVSEYPSFSHDHDSLWRSATEAMEQVKETGGNKVCLTTPAPGFQPDFLPRDSSSAPRSPHAGVRFGDKSS